MKRVGEEFTIILNSNPTTGYRWKLPDNSSGGIVESLGSEYQPPETQRKGAGGREIWRVKAVAAGKTTITLEYIRPWEKGVEPAMVKSYAVTVE